MTRPKTRKSTRQITGILLDVEADAFSKREVLPVFEGRLSTACLLLGPTAPRCFFTGPRISCRCRAPTNGTQ